VDVVDIVSIEKETGEVMLTVSDHLDWTDSVGHQVLLQKKLNAYLAFVESGEILQRYPKARGRSVIFKVVFRCRPDPGGFKFLARARATIRSAGFDLRHEIFADSYDN
jgi:hypothetical protein